VVATSGFATTTRSAWQEPVEFAESRFDLLKRAAPDVLQEWSVAKTVNSSLNKGGAEMVEPISFDDPQGDRRD